MALIASRSVPDARSSPGILICLLGHFRVFKAGRPVVLRSGGKGEAFLAELAMRPRFGVAREELLDAIWPDRRTTLAAQSLNSLVYSLQKALGGEGGALAPILLEEGHYRLNDEAGIGIDVVEFDALVAAGEQEARTGNAAGAVAAFGQAVDLYRGEFCSGAGMAAMIERERLRAVYLDLLARMADYHLARGQYRACLEWAHRLLASDPCREDAHRVAMRVYVRLGERTQALRQFRLCQRILRVEFDVEPEHATMALYERIRLDPASV